MDEYYKECKDFAKRSNFVKTLGLTPKESHKLSSLPSVVDKLISKFGVQKEERIPLVKKEFSGLRPAREFSRNWPVKATFPDGSIKYYKTKTLILNEHNISKKTLVNIMDSGVEWDGVLYSYLIGMKYCDGCDTLKGLNEDNFRVYNRKKENLSYTAKCRKCELRGG